MIQRSEGAVLQHSEIHSGTTLGEHSMPTTKKWERSDVERDIREMIVKLLMLRDVAPEDTRMSQPNFFTDLGATSIDTMELFLAIEKMFGFQFDVTELNPGLLVTLDRFVDLVYIKLQGKSGT